MNAPNQRRLAVILPVHKNEDQVNRLAAHLSKNFDVYLHIDKRSSLHVRKREHIFVYRKFKTYWGSYNFIRAILFLLKKARENGYDRYMLISGQDLPIKTNEEIQLFFQTRGQEEFINIEKLPTHEIIHAGFHRVLYYHREPGRAWIEDTAFRLFRKTRSVLFGGTRPLDYEFFGGALWFDISGKCVKKMFEYLEKDKKFLKRFKWTSCGDEIFFQTLLKRLDDLIIVDASLRYVDWETGPEKPRILRTEDYEKILNSGALFARKFDPDIDNGVMELLYKRAETALDGNGLA